MAEEQNPGVVFIADANFFIEGNTIVQAPPIIYTTQDALDEVRDHRSQANLEQVRLAHEIVIKEPTQESVDTVTKCATDSGNVILLSSTDIRLIALAFDFQPSEPEEGEAAPALMDEWITVENYGRIKDSGVILCTGDATMQCVAMIMKIKVISPTGQRVAEVKRWLLRCSACGCETLDASKEFCPECGHHELVRYALVMRDGIEKELPLPRRFWPTPKGKRYSVPLARGGRHGQKGIVLSEDMLGEARRKYIWAGGKKALQPASGDQFFEPRKKHAPPPQYGFGKANPNAPNHLLGKKKKRNRD